MAAEYLDNEDALTEASTAVGSDETTINKPYKDLLSLHWLTVHCGPRITLSSLHAAEIQADGCHTAASERGGLITYIHVSSRCRQHALAKFLQNLPGCTSARVVDAPDSKTLERTPEFLDFVKLLGRGSFSSEGDRLGLLSKHLKQATTAKQSSKRVDENTELRQRIAAMEKDYVVMEQRLQTAQRDCKKAEGEIGLTRSALSEAEDERELKRLRIENSEFRRLGAEEKEVRRLNRELMTLQDRFEEKARDCTVLEMTLCIARKDNAKLQDEAAKAPRPSNYMRR
jgi:hypothetical protein